MTAVAASSTHPLLVTQRDHERLQRVLDVYSDGANAEHAEALAWKLSSAQLAPSEAVPPDVVTMNSTVLVEDETRGEELELTLSYPQDARGAPGRVSVLAPVGSALLGLTPGERVELPLPRGGTRRLKLVAVRYQPEAAGHFHL